MSKVIVNKKYLQSRVKRDLLLGFLMVLTGIAGIIILSDFGMAPTLYMLIPFVGLVIPGVFYFKTFSRERERLKKDDAALKDLSRLPEKYTVLRNVYVPYQGNIIECDFVVIGENGIFVMEVNGTKGHIYESKDINYWLRYLSKRKAKIFVKAIGNQSTVVDRKVLALAEYLLRFNVHTWIQGIVYFSNKRSEVELVNQKAVFSDQSELLSYITSYPTKIELDELKIEKIVKLLHLDTLAK
ncbi:nuclease-related domain-containing protein [Vallitalea okinawensis]|uniref:nuclease-related domain-containing protein n=1 Tax=Vallitalea okinawensis TaxID=2078660 RepID=UPI000CFB74AD|nr:nuclease-related domain-containing protein [Vallitalea okinawensis]